MTGDDGAAAEDGDHNLRASTAQLPAKHSLLHEVRNLSGLLPPAEQRLADQLLTAPAAFAGRSISEVAEVASTSTTSVTRFYRRLGYQRFKDLRLALTEETLRDQLRVRNFPAQASDVSPTDTLHQVVAKIARDETLSITDTAEVLSVDLLAAGVRAIMKARRIDVFGLGASSVVGGDLAQKLSRIGRIALNAAEAHTAWGAAAVQTTGDVAVGISHSGRTPETIRFLTLARIAGATTIAITNNESSELASNADVVLLTAARETPFRSGALGSRIAQLMVIDCLFVGVVQADYDRSRAAIRATYEAVQARP